MTKSDIQDKTITVIDQKCCDHDRNSVMSNKSLITKHIRVG